ncbi:MAG TPA: homoserine dehydrogenase, partial [Candidatus Limnocylindrales bacterium]|nr:homoserine dehydrogenase [Candidatus Limnocylindrales bacterium]
MSGSPLRVAVLGAGTVGREVVHALLERSAGLRSADGPAPVLGAIAVRDVERAIAAGVPASMVSDAPAHLVADPEVDVVVELMGGDEPAHTLIAAALAMGKSVVTANKHVVAHHGAELEAIARRTGAVLRFEASVGGGIPVLGPLATDLAANRVERVRGIVNGTTNFILSAMTDPASPQEFEAALAEAQRLGYAEADPSGDVEGLDAVNKLVILARLAFDVWLDPAAIATRPDGADGPAGPGITTVSLADQQDAQGADRIIRLVATASARWGAAGDDEAVRIEAAVLPTALTIESALGRTAGVRNRVEIDAVPVGRVGFDGPGAGGAATSSAVLGDLLAIARGAGSTWGGRPAAAGPSGRPVAPPDRAVLTATS